MKPLYRKAPSDEGAGSEPEGWNPEDRATPSAGMEHCAAEGEGSAKLTEGEIAGKMQIECEKSLLPSSPCGESTCPQCAIVAQRRYASCAPLLIGLSSR